MACNLASAESIARNAGISFNWTETDRRLKASKWSCFAFDSNGKVVDSLHEIEFDSKGPYGSTYKRVVEAGIAKEIVTEIFGSEIFT